MIIQQNPRIVLVEEAKDAFEGEALQQLDHMASLEGVYSSVGLPDLHPGYGIPVGAAFLIRGRIYPHTVGNDIGCGVGLWQTSLQAHRLRLDRIVKRLHGSMDDEMERQPDVSEAKYSWLSSVSLGTIGSGNHFAELQHFETVYEEKEFKRLGLSRKNVVLLVHSGSRGHGETLLRRHTDSLGAKPLLEDTPLFHEYLEQHDQVLAWARKNRQCIAERIAATLQSACCQGILDICHNSIEYIERENVCGWLHRKGAASSDRGAVVIPGSRGSFSYLVMPQGEQKRVLFSLPHGAGRKWKRSVCRERLRAKFPPRMLTRTALGSIVLCENSDQLYEEAPQAYKNIERVLQTLQREGLVRVIATLRPLITYKEGMKKEGQKR